MGVCNSQGSGWSTSGFATGGLGFSTIIHEALHGLGLDHPHGGETLRGLNPNVSNYPFGEYSDFVVN